MKHICTVHFFRENSDNAETYQIYFYNNETLIECLHSSNKTVIQSSGIQFIDVLKQIGYKEKDCVYWENNSYCYHNWDITDIMRRPIYNFPDHFDFFIGDEDNGVPYLD